MQCDVDNHRQLHFIFIALRGEGGGGVERFLGDHFIFRRTEGGFSHNLKHKKGGSLKILDMRHEEGSQKLSIVMRGDHFNEITFKGGWAKFHRV